MQLFQEAGLEYVKSSLKDGGYVYQSTDKRLTVLQTNFFTVGGQYEQYFNCVWVNTQLAQVRLIAKERSASGASVHCAISERTTCQ